MVFEAKIVKTKNWRKTPYGVISMILLPISIIVIFILSPKIISERDYLSEWFGQNRRPFLWLNILFYINGNFVMLLQHRFNFETIGKVQMNNGGIKIIESSDSSFFNIPEIAEIRLYYYGYKSVWKSWGRGNQNFMTVVDQQGKECVFEFFLNSYEHKKNLIDQLLSFQKQGVKIRLDYLNPPNAYYPNDIDFLELKLQERWPNK